MRSILRKSSTPYGLFIAVFFVVFSIISLVLTARAQAASDVPISGKRLITIHDNGHDKAILTEATTLREAFKESGIRIDSNDMVEPGLDDPLVASNYDANVYRARPVIIVDGTIRKKVMTPYRTARQIVTHAGMTLQDEDLTTMSVATNMVSDGAGVQLTVDRATPFTLVLYGKKTKAYTQATTVADMLKEKEITLGAADKLSVAQTTPIKAGMKVELWRNGKQTMTQDESVPFDIEQIQDADHEVGYRKITTPGVKGKKTVTYEINVKNGHEVSRKVIQSVVTKKPRKQVEIVGAKPTFSGDFAAALARLRACEAGGNYANKNNPTYRGAYQYDYSTWANYKGYYDPADAPPAVQDERAWQTYQARGWSPWPVCGAGLPDTYR